MVNIFAISGVPDRFMGTYESRCGGCRDHLKLKGPSAKLVPGPLPMAPLLQDTTIRSPVTYYYLLLCFSNMAIGPLASSNTRAHGQLLHLCISLYHVYFDLPSKIFLFLIMRFSVLGAA